MRNKLFDYNILNSKSYEVPIICIGNLSTGGTGKSPMTEYIIRLLNHDFRVATLSRGYGRSSSGYRDVSPEDQAILVGDEPLQFARKFRNVQVAVCEDRQAGIETLLSKKSPPEVIILDDAYQHRKVNAGLNIVLTTYGNLYVEDYVLPTGNLREPISGVSRAAIVVVTKCPIDLSLEKQQAIRSKLNLSTSQNLYFSTIEYEDTVYSNKRSATLNSLKVKKVTLVTGIANPRPLVHFLREHGLSFEHKAFKDHHNYTASEIEEFNKLDTILTTEKDFVRLRSSLEMQNLFYLPIKTTFISDQKKMDAQVQNFVNSFTD